MKINCIIVDDEPASRELLERYIADIPSLELCKSCKNAIEANEAMRDFSVQLLFLDINMPRISGMKFYKSLSNPPYVIFTTAYPEYAVEGFEVDAIDYLLKPFPFERFLKSVNKAIDTIESKQKEGNTRDFILLKADKRINRIFVDEIYHLEAVGDYVKVNYNDKSLLVHSTFQDLLSQLSESRIVRIHKSHAISIQHFNAIEGNQVIVNGKQIPIGQSYREQFFKMIGNK